MWNAIDRVLHIGRQYSIRRMPFPRPHDAGVEGSSPSSSTNKSKRYGTGCRGVARRKCMVSASAEEGDLARIADVDDTLQIPVSGPDPFASSRDLRSAPRHA